MISKSKISRLLIIVSVCPFVLGATLEEWRKRPPRWEIKSERSLSELQGCLGSKWAGSLSMAVRMMPIEGGISYVNDGANRDILVDVTDEGGHRKIKLWLRKFFGITVGAEEQIKKLSDCAAPNR